MTKLGKRQFKFKKSVFLRISALIIGIILATTGCSQPKQLAENTNPVNAISQENKENNNLGLEIEKSFIDTESQDQITTKNQEYKIFNLIAVNFTYNIKEIRVNLGDVVKINLVSEDEVYDWVIDEFDVRTSQIDASEVASVIFTADKTGIFEYYCSVDHHRQKGMVGNFIVE